MSTNKSVSLALSGLPALTAVPTAATASGESTPPENMMAAQPKHAHAADFDFQRGEWIAHNRRLSKPLQDSNDWTEFTTHHHGAALMDGLANFEEIRSDKDGLLGMAFRTFNRKTRQWSIYWVANRDGVLQLPVVGVIDDGKGVFEADDVYDGKPIRSRNTWSGTTTATPRWEQAFSADGGKTWETNWIMEFSRPQR